MRTPINLWSWALSRPQYTSRGRKNLVIDQSACLTVLSRNFTLDQAGFGSRKLSQLYRDYPLGSLSGEGCIREIRGNHVYYNKVDMVRGIVADIAYLRLEAQLEKIIIHLPRGSARVNLVRASAVAPLVGFKPRHPLLRKPLDREVTYRLEKRYGENHSGTRIINDWAHTIGSPSRMVNYLKRAG